jgi:hypothetical protein
MSLADGLGCRTTPEAGETTSRFGHLVNENLESML